jgi:hypothetical protein
MGFFAPWAKLREMKDVLRVAPDLQSPEMDYVDTLECKKLEKDCGPDSEMPKRGAAAAHSN